MKHSFTILALVFASAAARADSPTTQQSIDKAVVKGAVAGAYTVPVKDPALKPYAVFPVTISSEYSEGQAPTAVSFDLPKELVGETPSHFVLNQDPSSLQWSGSSNLGEVVQGTCGVNAGTKVFGCNVKFVGLKTDLPSVDAFLSKTFAANPVELKSRLQVAHAFSGEPEGIYEYSLDAETPAE